MDYGTQPIVLIWPCESPSWGASEQGAKHTHRGHAHRVIWDPYQIAGASSSENLILDGAYTWKRVMAMMFDFTVGSPPSYWPRSPSHQCELSSSMARSCTASTMITRFLFMSTVRPISYHSKLSSWNQRSDTTCFAFLALVDGLGSACRDPNCRRCWWPRWLIMEVLLNRMEVLLK